jgi:hypothetical protein
MSFEALETSFGRIMTGFQAGHDETHDPQRGSRQTHGWVWWPWVFLVLFFFFFFFFFTLICYNCSHFHFFFFFYIFFKVMMYHMMIGCYKRTSLHPDVIVGALKIETFWQIP